MSEILEEKGGEVLENNKTPKGAETGADNGLEELSVIESTKQTKGKGTAKGTKATKPTEKVVIETEESEEVEKVKDPVMDFEIDPSKTYKFVSNKPGFRQMVPSTAVVWDEVNACPKNIVLTDTEESPYSEDHSAAVVPTRKQLAFVKGVLLIKGTNIPAIRYMLAYDGFSGKKAIMPNNKKIKNSYSLEEEEKKQAQLLEREKLKQEARSIVLEAEIEEVENFLLTRDKRSTGSQAIVDALKIADIAPEVVISSFENPLVEIKASFIRAKFKGLIAVVDNTLQSSKGQVLFTAKGRDVLEEVAHEVNIESEAGKQLSKLIV